MRKTTNAPCTFREAIMYRHIPNTLTLSRFPLTVLFLTVHITGWRWNGLVLIIVACITDWADGYLARRWKVVSDFGKNIDPYADKFLCWALMIVVISDFGLTMGLIPVVIATFTYDVGLGLIRYVFGRRNIATNQYAKWKTTALMVGLILLYADTLISNPLSPLGYLVGVGMTWIATWYALRSAANYLRGYGWDFLLVRPLHLL